MPFLDVRALNTRLKTQLIASLANVIDSGSFIRGERCALFEEQFARYCGVEGAVGVGNGLDALRLSLEAWKAQGRISAGDEVLVPANSFIASLLAITAAGLRPKLVGQIPKATI